MVPPTLPLKGPRGFVRDLRLRWACEEAGLAYSARTVPFDGRETNHLARQPFGQVPFLDDGGLKIFESGAGQLHLARKSERPMPRDPAGEAETVQWTVAALNPIEMVSVPWWFLKISGEKDNGLAGWMASRLDQLEKVLGEREGFSSGPKVTHSGYRRTTHGRISSAVDSSVERICRQVVARGATPSAPGRSRSRDTA